MQGAILASRTVFPFCEECLDTLVMGNTVDPNNGFRADGYSKRLLQ